MQNQTQKTKVKKILLIEGQQFVRTPLKRILASRGHHVVAVESGEKGLHTLVHKRFDTVVCSHHLPGINGLVFFSRSGHQLTNANTILTASFAGDYLANDALALGINVFMEMPYKIENLLACVEGRYGEICAGSLGQHLYVTNGGQMMAISPAQLNNQAASDDPGNASLQKAINLSGRRWRLYRNTGSPYSLSQGDVNKSPSRKRSRLAGLKIIDPC